MNVVPTGFVRMLPDDLKGFVAELYRKAGVTRENAELIASLLVATDLRGVFSHGSRQSRGYLSLLKERKLNPRPRIRVLQETPATAVLDGDGSLGHFVCWQAAHLAVQKAKEMGLGAVATRNHHHFGGAGKYSRVASGAGCVGFVVSSHVRSLTPERSIMATGGASPMSFAVPSGSEPPLVLDMSTNFYASHADDFEAVFAKMPTVFFKSLGLGSVCHVLGGILAGIVTVNEQKPAWPAVNQGAFMLAVDVSKFVPPDTFKAQMDAFVGCASHLRPFPGQDRALLPGALEWEREREWTTEGIPIGREHQAALEEAAADLEVRTPF